MNKSLFILGNFNFVHFRSLVWEFREKSLESFKNHPITTPFAVLFSEKYYQA